MMQTCPNCQTEFTEHRETAFYCKECAKWFTLIDKTWHTCPEPSDPKEEIPIDPASSGPVPESESGNDRAKSKSDRDRQPAIEDAEPNNVKSYLGGLLTVTTVEEHDEESES